jgi:hypothetical protein
MVVQLVNDIGPTVGTVVPESLFAFNRRNLRVIVIRCGVAENTVFFFPGTRRCVGSTVNP